MIPENRDCMQSKSQAIVLKFGGASVESPQSFSQIAEIIIDRAKTYANIAVVVSAMGDTTDKLIALAKEVHPEPPQRECDMLITVGERISISLLAMALAKKGVSAVSFTGSQSGIITCSQHQEAKILDVRPRRLFSAFQEKKIAIVAGFQGVSLNGEITTLGRGGSDTSAVALGVSLRASHVEFFKDVPGIFNVDPKLDVQAKQYMQLSYKEAIEIARHGAKVMHQRGIHLAKKNALPLFVTTFKEKGGGLGTWIVDRNLESPPVPLYEIEDRETN